MFKTLLIEFLQKFAQDLLANCMKSANSASEPFLTEQAKRESEAGAENVT